MYINSQSKCFDTMTGFFLRPLVEKLLYCCYDLINSRNCIGTVVVAPELIVYMASIDVDLCARRSLRWARQMMLQRVAICSHRYNNPFSRGVLTPHRANTCNLSHEHVKRRSSQGSAGVADAYQGRLTNRIETLHIQILSKTTQDFSHVRHPPVPH